MSDTASSSICSSVDCGIPTHFIFPHSLSPHPPNRPRHVRRLRWASWRRPLRSKTAGGRGSSGGHGGGCGDGSCALLSGSVPSGTVRVQLRGSSVRALAPSTQSRRSVSHFGVLQCAKPRYFVTIVPFFRVLGKDSLGNEIFDIRSPQSGQKTGLLQFSTNIICLSFGSVRILVSAEDLEMQ